MCCALAVDTPHQKENPADRESLGLNGEAMNKKSGSSGMHDLTSVAGQLDVRVLSSSSMLNYCLWKQRHFLYAVYAHMSMQLNNTLEGSAVNFFAITLI
jgi:hypothetical protein